MTREQKQKAVDAVHDTLTGGPNGLADIEAVEVLADVLGGRLEVMRLQAKSDRLTAQMANDNYESMRAARADLAERQSDMERELAQLRDENRRLHQGNTKLIEATSRLYAGIQKLKEEMANFARCGWTVTATFVRAELDRLKTDGVLWQAQTGQRLLCPTCLGEIDGNGISIHGGSEVKAFLAGKSVPPQCSAIVDDRKKAQPAEASAVTHTGGLGPHVVTFNHTASRWECSCGRAMTGTRDVDQCRKS